MVSTVQLGVLTPLMRVAVVDGSRQLTRDELRAWLDRPCPKPDDVDDTRVVTEPECDNG